MKNSTSQRRIRRQGWAEGGRKSYVYGINLLVILFVGFMNVRPRIMKNYENPDLETFATGTAIVNCKVAKGYSSSLSVN